MRTRTANIYMLQTCVPIDYLRAYISLLQKSAKNPYRIITYSCSKGCENVSCFLALMKIGKINLNTYRIYIYYLVGMYANSKILLFSTLG